MSMYRLFAPALEGGVNQALVNYCKNTGTTAAGNLHMDIARVDHGLRFNGLRRRRPVLSA